MIIIQVDVSILQNLQDLQVKLSSPDAFLDRVGEYLIKRADEGFNQQTDPYGKQWVALSPATLTEKQRQGFPSTILTRTGALRASLKATRSGNIVTISMGSVAQYHQFGTKKMPQRQILPDGSLSSADEANIQNIAVTYLQL